MDQSKTDQIRRLLNELDSLEEKFYKIITVNSKICSILLENEKMMIKREREDNLHLFIQNLNSELQVVFDNYCAYLDKNLSRALKLDKQLKDLLQ